MLFYARKLAMKGQKNNRVWTPTVLMAIMWTVSGPVSAAPTPDEQAEATRLFQDARQYETAARVETTRDGFLRLSWESLWKDLKGLLLEEASLERVRQVLGDRMQTINAQALRLPWSGEALSYDQVRAEGHNLGTVSLWYEKSGGGRGVYIQPELESLNAHRLAYARHRLLNPPRYDGAGESDFDED